VNPDSYRDYVSTVSMWFKKGDKNESGHSYKICSTRSLKHTESDKPTPTGNEVLIRVYAASVNRSDNHVLTGRPFLMRLFTGLFKPKLATTGSDFAGQIEATGPAVTSFKVGDKVMGFGGGLGFGTHAQYITFPETKRIVLIPAT